MQIIVVTIFTLITLRSAYSQDKVAITVGADHRTGRQFVKAQNVQAYNSLKEAGYTVRSLFGDESRSKQFSKETKSLTRPFTFDNLKKSISNIYSKPCEERPSQLMLNFVAHGSRNAYDSKTKRTIPRHSINGFKQTASGGMKKQRIYADQIANYIKDQKKLDPSCDRPKLAIFDHSCKSGASTSAFSGLGCVLTSTSGHNSTSDDFIHQTFDKIKASKGKSLADLHLELLVNQDVKLVNIDYQDGKTVLQRIYNNTNQISGCGDENQVNYSPYTKSASKPFAPLCQEYIGVLEELRNTEIKTVRKIVTKLKIDQEIDKQTLAEISGVNAEKIPDSERLSDKLDELIAEDKNEFEKVNPLALEESSLMDHEDIGKITSCGMKTGGQSRTSDIGTSELSKNMAETICKTIYSDDREYRNCASLYRGKRVGIALKDLLQIQRDQSVFPTKRSVGFVKSQLADNGKSRKLGARSNVSYSILKRTASQCIKKLSESGTPAQKKAIAFFKKHYKKVDENCEEETISCHLEKSKQRSDKIKKYLSYARGYAYLSCKSKLEKNKDLKSCEDFEI